MTMSRRLGLPWLRDQDPMSRFTSHSALDSYQGITLPPIQLRGKLRAGQRRAEWEEPESEVQRPPQQLQSSHQSAPPSQSIPTKEDWRTPAPTRNSGLSSILNPIQPDGSAALRCYNDPDLPTGSPLSAVDPAPPSISTIHVFSGQEQLSGTSPTADGYIGTFPPGVRRILTPESTSKPTSAQRAAIHKNIDAGRLPFSPESGLPYMAKPGQSTSTVVPPMPTPPAQSDEPQYEYPSRSRPPTDAWRSSGGKMQAPTSPASSSYSKVGRSPQTTNSDYPELSLGITVQKIGVMKFQMPPEVPDIAPVTQSQDSSFYSGNAGNSKQTSASDSIQILKITTSEGSYNLPVDVHQASRVADEKRARNAGASARFRQRRKENEREAKTTIEKMQSQNRDLERKVRELEQERDFYRAERDRFREVVYKSPDTRHLVMQAPSSPQSMRAGSFPGSMSQMDGPPPPHPPSKMGFQAPKSSSERAPRRRRTDTQGGFTSLPYTPPPASTLRLFKNLGYPPGPGHGTNLPPMPIDNTALPLTTASNTTPATAAGPPPPYEPYSRGPYERGWPGTADDDNVPTTQYEERLMVDQQIIFHSQNTFPNLHHLPRPSDNIVLPSERD